LLFFQKVFALSIGKAITFRPTAMKLHMGQPILSFIIACDIKNMHFTIKTKMCYWTVSNVGEMGIHEP